MILPQLKMLIPSLVYNPECQMNQISREREGGQVGMVVTSQLLREQLTSAGQARYMLKWSVLLLILSLYSTLKTVKIGKSRIFNHIFFQPDYRILRVGTNLGLHLSYYSLFSNIVFLVHFLYISRSLASPILFTYFMFRRDLHDLQPGGAGVQVLR